MSKGLGRLRWRQLSTAYLRWVEHVSEVQWQRRVVGRALAKMANRRLAMAFDAFGERVRRRISASARMQQVGGGVAVRLLSRDVCCAMATWHGVVVLRRLQLQSPLAFVPSQPQLDDGDDESAYRLNGHVLPLCAA